MKIFINFQKRVGEETTSQGLAGVKYMFEDNALDNGAKDERNKCYCREGELQLLFDLVAMSL